MYTDYLYLYLFKNIIVHICIKPILKIITVLIGYCPVQKFTRYLPWGRTHYAKYHFVCAVSHFLSKMGREQIMLTNLWCAVIYVSGKYCRCVLHTSGDVLRMCMRTHICLLYNLKWYKYSSHTKRSQISRHPAVSALLSLSYNYIVLYARINVLLLEVASSWTRVRITSSHF